MQFCEKENFHRHVRRSRATVLLEELKHQVNDVKIEALAANEDDSQDVLPFKVYVIKTSTEGH